MMKITSFLPSLQVRPEPHPGLLSWQTISFWRRHRTASAMDRVRVVPPRANILAGIRTTLPEPTPPPTYAFVMGQLPPSAVKQGISPRLMIARDAAPSATRLSGLSRRQQAYLAQQARAQVLLNDLTGGT